ncbi:S-layer homology domain-containing protein [Bacillus sp. REN10]|uniref:S-layer homology domain-containing protein n=1 Tax=Bacillus sp. REN10 TaxID=2782541 RepID=UPI00193C750D|nr:S-layer homology domain-containing protein [Bacillus sp. REN10]
MGFQAKSYRKFIAASATATLVATAVTPAFAASFDDVNDRVKEAVSYLVDNKIAKGTSETTFGTYNQITRANAAVMIANALKLTETSAPDAGFKDVPARAKAAVNALKAAGILNGKTETTFGANDPLTRGEMAVILTRAYKLDGEGTNHSFKDVNKNYTAAVNALLKNKITSGKTETAFGTNDNLTRGDFAVFLFRADTLEVKEEVKAAVESVKALNATQVQITGTGLDQFKADQFTLAGNKVLSLVANKDNTEATLTLEKAVPSSVEQVLKLTEKVEGQADVVTEFKFTFTLDVTAAKALTSRIDEAKDGQFLKFSINDEATAADVAYLKEAGYTVKFQSTKPAVFADDSTGEIDEAQVAAGDKFSYKVVITKGDKTVESELVEVTVVDEKAITTAITAYDLFANTDVAVKSGKIALNDANVSLANVKGTLLDGTKEAAINDATFKTSNPAVAVIDHTGKITPVAPGTVKFTIASGDAKVEVPVTIVADARVATTATTNVSSSKLVNGATQSVSVEVKDQYGDAFKGLDLAAFDVKNSKNETIATSNDPAATDAAGKTSFTVTADAANVGTGALQIKNAADKTLATVNLTIAATGDVASRKLELADSAKDLQLDIVKGSTDKEVSILWNQYNASGFLIGPEKDFDEDGAAAGDTGKYTVASSDTNVATVAVDDSTGAITVTGGTKSGTATIKVLEGTVVRATINVNVVNSTPSITAVSFEAAEVKAVKFLDLDAEVLKAEKVTLSADKKVSISDTGVIYIEVANAGYDAADDITLGTVTAVSNVVDSNGVTVPVEIAGGKLGKTAGAAFSAGDNGSVVVKVTRDGETTPLAVSTINVNIPK